MHSISCESSRDILDVPFCNLLSVFVVFQQILISLIGKDISPAISDSGITKIRNATVSTGRRGMRHLHFRL